MAVIYGYSLLLQAKILGFPEPQEIPEMHPWQLDSIQKNRQVYAKITTKTNKCMYTKFLNILS